MALPKNSLTGECEVAWLESVIRFPERELLEDVRRGKGRSVNSDRKESRTERLRSRCGALGSFVD